MNGLDGLQIIQAVFAAPSAKAAGSARAGPAGGGVADLPGEKFEGAFGRPGIKREERREGGELAELNFDDCLRHFSASHHER